MRFTRPGDDQIAAFGSYAGVALLVIGPLLAVRTLDQPAPSFTGGHFWAFVSTAYLPIVMGLLVLATSALLTGERRRPEWTLSLGVAALVGAVALAFKAASAPVFWGGIEDGVWGFLRAATWMMAFPVLLLLPLSSRARPLGGPSVWGVQAGLALVVIAIALGLHQAREEPLSSVWTFVGAALHPAGLGVLLILTALPGYVTDQTRRSTAIVVASVIVVAGLGHAFDFVDQFPNDHELFFLSDVTGWVSLALLILAATGLLRLQTALLGALAVAVATLVHAAWLATLGDLNFDLWAFLYVAQSGLAYAALIVLCAALSDRHRAEAQPSEFVSASSVAP